MDRRLRAELGDHQSPTFLRQNGVLRGCEMNA
jgi:hypothetical protein